MGMPHSHSSPNHPETACCCAAVPLLAPAALTVAVSFHGYFAGGELGPRSAQKSQIPFWEADQLLWPTSVLPSCTSTEWPCHLTLCCPFPSIHGRCCCGAQFAKSCWRRKSPLSSLSVADSMLPKVLHSLDSTAWRGQGASLSTAVCLCLPLRWRLQPFRWEICWRRFGFCPGSLSAASASLSPQIFWQLHSAGAPFVTMCPAWP